MQEVGAPVLEVQSDSLHNGDSQVDLEYLVDGSWFIYDLDSWSQLLMCYGLRHFLTLQAAVKQEVAAAEGGAAGFATADCASSPGDMQV